MLTRRLHIFVPENDLALAAGKSNYTPPPIGWKMHLAGEALPMCYGNPGDMFITEGFNDDTLRRLQTLLGDDIRPASRSEIASGDYLPCPWGWSAYTRSLMKDYGVPEAILPDADTIERLRQLGHRRTSIEINRLLAEALPFPTPALPVELNDISEVEKTLSESGDFYLKQPWSGSGRGVIPTAGASAASVMQFAAGSIRRQGSVIIEKALESVGDFAMLWNIKGGKAEFAGYSRFLTHNTGGKYAGNLVASQDGILADILSLGISENHLEQLVATLPSALEQTIGSSYEGPAGIDMLAYRTQDSILPAPCIELNLRYTMGFVAKGIADRLNPEKRMILAVVTQEEFDKLPEGATALSQPGPYYYVIKPVE